MRRTIIIYALALAALTALLKIIEYKYLIHDMSLEMYMGIIAVFFTVFGVWAGIKLIGGKKTVIKEVPIPISTGGEFILNERELNNLNISTREYEVLEGMSKGLSNQEIANELFISLSTVKTHAANLYVKLDVKRRTQAVQRAKELSLIP